MNNVPAYELCRSVIFAENHFSYPSSYVYKEFTSGSVKVIVTTRPGYKLNAFNKLSIR